MDDWDYLIPHQFPTQDEMHFMDFCQNAFNGNTARMESMLSSELVNDVNKQSPKKKDTALHYACRGGQLLAVEFLIERGADVNLKDVRGKNSVHVAASLGNLELLLYLMSKGGDLEVIDKFNRSPLHWAAANKHVHIVKALLGAGVKIYYAVSGNWQALHEAVKSGDAEITKLLIDHGSEVNALVQKSKVAPFSPLHIACREGHLECVKLLLEHGALTNHTNEGNQTPLHEAAHSGVSYVVHKLLLHGANPHFENKLDRTPLHEACNQGHMRCSIYLLDAGSDVNARDHMNETPLCHLLRHGVNKVTQEELISCTDVLLQYGANPNIPGYQDETAVMVANTFRERDIADMIYEAMESPRTLLHICKMKLRLMLGVDYSKVHELPLPTVLQLTLVQNSAYYSRW